MEVLFDRKIHQDEFRLRLLVTNGCNKNCSFCLNDFQPKPVSVPTFLPLNVAQEAIDAYLNFMITQPTSIITFSGGEPGLHPNLINMVEMVTWSSAIAKVVTNGLAMEQSALLDLVDCWHVGVTNCSNLLFQLMEKARGTIIVQAVVTKETSDNEINHLINFYSEIAKVKLFVNFFAKGSEKLEIESKITKAYNKHPDKVLSRFTGKQENRGLYCKGCHKECVTLKALWVFPDGTVSPCPQNIDRIKPDKNEFPDIMAEAYKAHCFKGEINT